MRDLETDEAQAHFLLEGIRKYEQGCRSLVDFRNIFFPSKRDVPSAEFHYKWSDILLNGKEHYAIEGFRECAKTQYVMMAFPLYCMVYPCDDFDFIVLICSDEETAHSRLKGIKDEFKANDALNVGLLEIKEDNETTFEVVVKKYRSDEAINIRLQVFGKGSQIRGLENKGRRPKIVIMDDVQDKKAMESDSILRKDLKWFMGDVLFLGERCRIFMIGNNLGEKCLIEQVFADAENLRFTTERVTALDVETENIASWPDKLSAVRLIDERQRYQNMGQLDVWYRERMCKATSPDDQRFKKEMFRYYDPKQIPKVMNIYTAVDLAISLSKRADYSAVCTVGVTKDNHWFILDIDYGRWLPNEIMDAIFRAVSKWRPLEVGWEKVAFQAVIGHLIQKEMPQRGLFFRSKGLIAERRKELRIEMLSPRFSTGTVWFPRGASFLDELERELLSFPTGIHDDLIDALAYIEQLALVPRDWAGESVEIPVAGSM